MQFAPDGRLFVCEQQGRIRVIKQGELLDAPFLSLETDSRGERGLLGVAFDPAFEQNGYVYVYYTAPTSPARNRVSRFTADGDAVSPGTEAALLDLDPLNSVAHNGGALQFGTDGKLYVAVGDNVGSMNAQSLSTLLGKILRLNPDGTIPTDNPFYGSAEGANQSIWALGLRNPFSFAIQPTTGRMFINDVGEDVWEEINEGAPGANFGWPICDGACHTPDAAFSDPRFQYEHGSGEERGNSIVGAAFYNSANPQFPPEYHGAYFFGDYVSGWIRWLDPSNPHHASTFASGIDELVDLKIGPDGGLYYLSRGFGEVYAIYHGRISAPAITHPPVNQAVVVGSPARFSVDATGSEPLSYQWQRDGIDIPGATSRSLSLPLVQLGDEGAEFRVIVRNGFGEVTSPGARLLLRADSPPVGEITLPAAGSLFSAGDTITFAGAASDPDTGSLPGSAFSWTIVFHHDTHTHPFLGPINGVTSGTFSIPTVGETSPDIWYRVHLLVTDTAGNTHVSFVDIAPRTSTLSFQTRPPRLSLTLDGQPLMTPTSIVSVVGMNRTLGVAPVQPTNANGREFSFWSDGGAQTHTITVPTNDTAFTALFGDPRVLIARGALWRYLDDGSDFGPEWRHPDFDDSTWPSGPAVLGYGGASKGRPEVTTVDFGPSPGQRHITTYFRRSWDIPNAANIAGLTLSLLRDDGAVVYLNGTEVFRSNMPEGEILSQTLASDSANLLDETTLYSTVVDPALLVEGTNTVAVEVHQVAPFSADLSFDLELRARYSLRSPPVTTSSAVIAPVKPVSIRP
jgi:glucose/arabinose dehydrogenase